MAQTIIRLRRTLSLSSNILSHIRLTVTAVTTNALLSPISPPLNPSHRHFHTTHCLSYKNAVARPTKSFSDMEKIDPDTVLFEGCDYKHWLIVMSFGKDTSQHPPREEMIDTYVRTCAQVVGSVEEAKKKIYACSTTTYTGFQVEVDEETSQKFEGLPGVIFVLPDSYIDPVNKEYGGDKYNNGEIIPRPPPVQYGRTTRLSNPRHRDQMTNPQRNAGYISQGPVRRDGERHMSHGSPQEFRQQPNYPSQQINPSQQTNLSQQHYPPQQNYGSYGQGERGNPMPSVTHHSGGVRDGFHVGWTSDVPPHQGNHNNGHNYPQGQISSPSGPQDGYITQGQFSNYSGGQGQMGNRPIDHGYNNHQTVVSNHPGNHGGYTPKGQMDNAGDNRNYSSSPGVGAYGHSGTGTYGPGPDGSYRQGAGTGFGGGHMSSGENQRFPQTSYQQSKIQEHRNYMPGAQTGVDQGRN